MKMKSLVWQPRTVLPVPTMRCLTLDEYTSQFPRRGSQAIISLTNMTGSSSCQTFVFFLKTLFLACFPMFYKTAVAHRIRLGPGLIEYKFETIALHEDKSLFGSQGRLAHHHLSWVQYITGHLPFGFGQAPWLVDKLLSIMLGSFSLLQSL